MLTAENVFLFCNLQNPFVRKWLRVASHLCNTESAQALSVKGVVWAPWNLPLSMLKSALLQDLVTNESNLGWVPLTWPWPVQTIGQAQSVEKMFCTNKPSGGHRSVKGGSNAQSFQVHVNNESCIHRLSFRIKSTTQQRKHLYTHQS